MSNNFAGEARGPLKNGIHASSLPETLLETREIYLHVLLSTELDLAFFVEKEE